MVLEQYHSESLNHVGRDKLFSYLNKKFYWSGMFEDTNRWVKACLTCRKHKPAQPTYHGLLEPVKARSPFEIVGIDIMGPFRRTPKGNRYVLVFIDYFTNWVEACALKNIEAKEVADKFYKQIITRHGCPFKIITDQGTQFTSDLFRRWGCEV